MKNNADKLVAITIIVILGFLYQYKYLSDFPSYKHAWAQSDRYALSLGFMDNGFNFFKPQTFNYNRQFPYEWKVPSDQTITAVDFPIHDYIPALLMKITGTTSPRVFRLYILLYSFLGLYYLFKLSQSITKDSIKSLFVLVFAATSPLFVYYQGGFLPTIPSLSNAIIGIYFYVRYLTRKKYQYFWPAMLFLTLAALARLTFVIPLIAVLAVELLRILKKETKILPLLLPVGLATIILIAYQIYNNYLREIYGSIFLNHLMPPDGSEEAANLFKAAYERWFYQYFTGYHYAAFVLVVLFIPIYLIKQKVNVKNQEKYFGVLIAIYLFGCLLFTILMLKQFPVHDYYFLDTAFLPVIMLLIFMLSLIPPVKRKLLKVAFAVVAGMASLLLILQPIHTQVEVRAASSNKTKATVRNFTGSAQFLDSLNIPRSSKILVMDPVAPNIPFILMQRKGFVVIITSKRNIIDALKWDIDYIVVQDEYFISDIYAQYPGILSRLKKIADNGKISVCKLTENNPQTLLDFMGLSKRVPVYKESVSFEEQPNSLWHNFRPTDSVAFSGASSGHLTPDLKYGLAFKTHHLPVLSTASRTLLFHARFLHSNLADCQIVAAISINGRNLYFNSYNLKNILLQKDSWEPVFLIFQLPKVQNS